MEPRFDFEEVFDEDYLYFYEDAVGDEPSDRQAELIWALLELDAGMPVLDLACGHGRIANRLAARGARVTGLDATPRFLDLARADARERGVDVEYVLGDMRELPWTERFERVLCWFTSFGYFDDDGNRRVLAGAFRALRPGGRLLIENNNVAWLLPNARETIVNRRGDDLAVDFWRFDARTSRGETERLIVRDGRVRTAHFSVRMFLFAELRDWLLEAGFGRVDGYDRDGGELTAESRRMVTVAVK